MIGVISVDGFLKVKRGSIYKNQGCPFTQRAIESAVDRQCGEWCPMFDLSQYVVKNDKTGVETRDLTLNCSPQLVIIPITEKELG